jgi:hypothetical protein
MRFTEFVQSGNKEQSDENGMSSYVYTFGARHNEYENDFTILDTEGDYAPGWSIRKEVATTFRLKLFFEKKQRDGLIPF